VERWALRVLKIRLNDELGERFLKVVARVYGPGEAQVERAAEEAIRLWVAKYEKTIYEPSLVLKDPIGSLKGLLKHVRKTGVELQHEARLLRER